MMSKYTRWYNNQSEATKAWLDKQSIWHDRDMVKAVMFGSVIGFVIGVLI
jgi:hypothetical protein